MHKQGDRGHIGWFPVLHFIRSIYCRTLCSSRASAWFCPSELACNVKLNQGSGSCSGHSSRDSLMTVFTAVTTHTHTQLRNALPTAFKGMAHAEAVSFLGIIVDPMEPFSSLGSSWIASANVHFLANVTCRGLCLHLLFPPSKWAVYPCSVPEQGAFGPENVGQWWKGVPKSVIENTGLFCLFSKQSTSWKRTIRDKELLLFCY